MCWALMLSVILGRNTNLSPANVSLRNLLRCPVASAAMSRQPRGASERSTHLVFPVDGCTPHHLTSPLPSHFGRVDAPLQGFTVFVIGRLSKTKV